jgi:BirA family transcriptional regulator, biotin operon repressor / biotin---[acetyl-CoA-carboxylase] ligase
MPAENHTPAQATPPGRKPLDAASLVRAVVRPGGLWQAVEVADRTGSTNADLLARALAGAPEGVVLAAEEQSAGRGRMGRTWVSPPRAALTFSLLVRPAAVPPARRGWLPLLAGVAVASAVTAVTGVQTRLKWPNDVLTGAAKLGGILAEATGDAVVVGVGLNVSAEPGELPPPGPGALAATSLRIARSAAPEIADSAAPDIAAPAAPEREPLLIAILADFERWYQAWCRVGGDPERCGLRARYTELSGTIGRHVRAELPDGQLLSGLAADVDPDGRLLVRVPSGTVVPVAAGDIVHLR